MEASAIGPALEKDCASMKRLQLISAVVSAVGLLDTSRKHTLCLMLTQEDSGQSNLLWVGVILWSEPEIPTEDLGKGEQTA